MAPYRFPYRSEAGPQRSGLVLALALHAGVIGALLAHPPTRAAIASSMPIMVSLITSEPAVAPPTPPKPTPVRPKAQPKPIEPALLEAAPHAPEPIVAPAPLPPPPAESAPSQPEPVTVAVVEPRFDAAYLQNSKPSYPGLSRRMHEEGKVLLRVLVTPNGTADKVELQKSSGHVRLDNAALDTVKSWRFVPARQGVHPVPAWVIVPISFALEG
jgi:protein TonB